jgi:putative membrane protein
MISTRQTRFARPAIAVAVILLVVGGCNSKSETDSPQAVNTDPMLTDTASFGIASPQSGPVFANQMAQSDAFEIASAEVAREKGQSPQVKAFADMMLVDHAKSSAALKAATAQVSPKFAPSATISGDQQAQLVSLRSANGADFDTLYASQQIAAHQAAVKALETYAATGDMAPLKDFAGKTLATVRQHLDQARKLPQ